MDKDLAKVSRFLSYVLRHNPGEIGLTLDEAGWVEVDALLAACARHGNVIPLDTLRKVVETNEKSRFAFSEDGRRIRASQGHSVDGELGYEPATPPDVLYHGTVDDFVPAIRKDGLKKMGRHHVHLSADQKTAMKVGERRGRPVLLRINAAVMRDRGLVFYRSANGVWLTEAVPAEYIGFPDEITGGSVESPP